MAVVSHIYGRTITFRYIPIAGDDGYQAFELVSARLYGPNAEPTDEQIEDAGSATTGHVGTRVTTWAYVNEEGTGDNEYKLTFDAITDSEPTSNTEYDKFYVALNYRATSGGPVLRDVEQIIVYRPDGLTSKIRVKAQDIFDLESKIEDLAPSQIWVEAKIDAAIEELMGRLGGRGYIKRRLFNLEKLNAAVKRLATALCCFDLAGEDNQFWMTKYDRWKEQAELLFGLAKLGFDAAGDDKPDPEAVVSTGGAVAFLR